MNFDYYTLKKKAKEGERLGNWKGMPVFACSAADLDNRGNGAYYILYDDENKMVAKINYGWKSYGEVSESGSVSEYSAARKYTTVAARTSTSGMKYGNEVPVAAAVYVPQYDKTEHPVGDVKLEIDVEAVLKNAREMSVADLLEGFNYGLDMGKN